MNAHMKQATEKLLKIKVKDSKSKKKEKEEAPKKEKGGANMCRLKNHDHTWSKCRNNPISKNFTGKLYTEIPASERNQQDFAKKAKKMPKDEKETQKKVSSSSGDLHIVQKTPIVKIKRTMNPRMKIILRKVIKHRLKFLRTST